MTDAALTELENRFTAARRRIFGRSLHVLQVDAGSCNLCEAELRLLTNPYYDVHRLGIFFTNSPRHADVMLVTGPVTRGMEEALRNAYEAMAEPRLVIAVGACACDGGIFAKSPTSRGPLDAILPVDVYIPGCPPNPFALIQGLLMAIGRWPEKPAARTPKEELA